MGIHVIFNPEANAGAAAGKRRELESLLERSGVGYEVFFTRGPNHATELARQLLGEGADHIVAVGGDGTFNEVANGFFDRCSPVNPDAVMSIIPLGSGNDFLRALGMKFSIEDAVHRVVYGKDRAIDVGCARIQSGDGGQTVRHFINYADFGFSAEVASWFNRYRRPYLSPLWYFLGVFAAWRHRRSYDVKAVIDGREVDIANVLMGIMCNGTTIGGGMTVAPLARIDDGLLDVYFLRSVKLPRLLPMLSDVYRGRHQENEYVRYFRASTVEIRVLHENNVIVGMEGEQPGFLPASYTIMPKSLKVRT